MSLTERQHALRRTGLTATDMVILSGFSRWGTPIEVYEQKLGAPPKDSTLAMEMGHAAEGPVMARVAQHFGLTVWPGATVRDRIVDYFLATPDRFVGTRAPEVSDHGYIVGAYPEAVCEGKLVGFHLVGEWYEDDPDAEGGRARVFPASVAVQTCWQMGVCRAPRNYVGALLGGWRDEDLHMIEVPKNEDLWGSLRVIGDKFWSDHVLARRPPPPDASDRAKEAIERLYPRIKRPVLIEATGDVADKARRYMAAREREKAAALEKRQLANELRLDVQDAAGVIGPDFKVTWSERAGEVDLDALCAAHGISADERDQHRKPKTRTLRVAPLSKKEIAYRHAAQRHAAE